MQTQSSRLVDKLICSCQHAAFTGGKILGGIETETGRIGATANRLVFISRTNRVCCVFNQQNVVTVGNITNSIQFNGMTGIVHSDNGLCLRRDGLLDFQGINIKRIRFHIHKDRSSTSMLNDVHGRRKRAFKCVSERGSGWRDHVHDRPCGPVSGY